MQPHAVRRRDVGVVDRVVQVATAVGRRAGSSGGGSAGRGARRSCAAGPGSGSAPPRACCSLADFLLLGGGDRCRSTRSEATLVATSCSAVSACGFERPAWWRGSRRPRSGLPATSSRVFSTRSSVSVKITSAACSSCSSDACLVAHRVEALEGVDGVLGGLRVEPESEAEGAQPAALVGRQREAWRVRTAARRRPACPRTRSCARVVAAGRSQRRAAPASPGRARSLPAPGRCRSASRACALPATATPASTRACACDQLRRDLVDVVLLILDLVLHRSCGGASDRPRRQSSGRACTKAATRSGTTRPSPTALRTRPVRPRGKLRCTFETSRWVMSTACGTTVAERSGDSRH